jgi:hypothetical protein
MKTSEVSPASAAAVFTLVGLAGRTQQDELCHPSSCLPIIVFILFASIILQ